jgi:hypothetical protein
MAPGIGQEIRPCRRSWRNASGAARMNDQRQRPPWPLAFQAHQASRHQWTA